MTQQRYGGVCYGGPWDGKKVVSSARRMELMERGSVTLTPPQADDDQRNFMPVTIAGAYTWCEPKDKMDTRGDHWQWMDHK